MAEDSFRSVPASASGENTGGLDAGVAHPARVYDYWLRGKDNYAVGREAAEKVIAVNSNVLPDVRANRAFLGRAVRFARRGRRTAATQSATAVRSW